MMTLQKKLSAQLAPSGQGTTLATSRLFARAEQ
jgi:hypothetical protein